ncbi:MBOAT family O-acyltransferase [Geomonas propionica]|uniref:MBOAT family protein n=1 Tax=Geomonas propionica TaxID=2798582 RepID=A0ABS0YSR9_9BACT|nr:MBOAT family protein [Geomonas propionica]MBJ6801028.1 MBOAT family protein [Geomonas propionica]
MLFSSYIFLFVFLPAALLLYYLTPARGRNLALTGLSYFFYGWANPYFTLLLFASTAISYFCAVIMARRPGDPATKELPLLDDEAPVSLRQKAAFWLSIVANLSLLGFFKYFNFGLENLNALLVTLGLDHLQVEGLFRIALPLGISFYVFKTVSYTIDVWQGSVRATRNFADFACYVSLFPQLIAGPIVRYREVAAQLASRIHTSEKFARGTSFMCLGLAKKVLLADTCGKVADTCFNAATLSTLDAWYGLFAYTMQIYFDFSAYSDMAIGVCLMFGFVISKNFDSPYHADSFADFWRRWHISLSTWLRDYLFTPLNYMLLTDRVRERMVREKFRYNYPAIASSVVVFTICGIWHGAGWTFAAWGAMHGILLALEQLRTKKSAYWKWPKALRVCCTFVPISLAWVFFRAADLGSAFGYFGSLFGLAPKTAGTDLVAGVIYQPYYLLTVAAAAVLVWSAPQTWDFTRALTWRKATWCYVLLLISIATLVTKAHSPFIYAAF